MDRSDHVTALSQYMTGRGYMPMPAREVVADIMLHSRFGGLWPKGTQQQWLSAVALGVSQKEFVIVDGKLKLAPVDVVQDVAVQLELF